MMGILINILMDNVIVETWIKKVHGIKQGYIAFLLKKLCETIQVGLMENWVFRNSSFSNNGQKVRAKSTMCTIQIITFD